MAAVKTKKPSKIPSKQLKAGKKKPLNRWILVGGVAVVALVGVIVVRLSGASNCGYTGYSFVHCARLGQISGGSLSPDKTIKYYPYGNGKFSTLISSDELLNSSVICAHWKNPYGKKIDFSYTVTVYDANKKQRAYTGGAMGVDRYSGNVCSPSIYKFQAARVGGWVEITFDTKNNQAIAVDNIYGKW